MDEATFQAIAAELFDRQGILALQICLQPGGSKEAAYLRERLSDALLEMLAKKNPWAAYEIFQRHRPEFHPSWSPHAREEFILASCGVSAEKTVEVASDANREILSDTVPDFPSGYEFRKALEDPVLSTRENRNLRDGLLAGWARRAPAEAIDWLISQLGPEISRQNEELARVCKEAARSSAAGRGMALEHLSQLPADLRESLSASLAGQASEKMEPCLLEMFAALGQPESYLTEALLETRGVPALDASWSALPVELRESTLDAALAKWSEDDPGPLAGEARTHWQEMVRRGWAAGETK